MNSVNVLKMTLIFEHKKKKKKKKKEKKEGLTNSTFPCLNQI